MISVRRNIRWTCIVLCLVFTDIGNCQDTVNLTVNAKASSSSARDSYLADNAVDQKVSDESRWLSAKNDPKGWLQIDFSTEVDIGVVDVFSGYQDGSPIQEFDVALNQSGKWTVPENGRVRGNQDVACRLKMSAANVSSLKITLVRPSAGRIREVAVYEKATTPIGSGLKADKGVSPVDRSQHQIAVNQIGYDSNLPKRFTAPLTEDGTEFFIRQSNGSETLLSGKIENQIGDFSDLDQEGEFVIEIPSGDLKGAISDPFLVSNNIVEKYHWQGAIDFLIDSRAVVGSHPSAYGGCPWRDGTYYDALIPSLVLFYLADPELNESLPHQIDWEADKKRVNSSSFKFDKKNPCSEGVMDAVRGYYQMAPPNSDAPDVVKLIHWEPDTMSTFQRQKIQAGILWAARFTLKHWNNFHTYCGPGRS